MVWIATKEVKLMDLKRFFTDDSIIGKTVELTGDEFYHAIKVTRHKVGFDLIICNNTEWDYYGKVKEITKNSAIIDIVSKRLNPSVSDKEITLYLGMCKDFDTALQKAVEMGVKKVVPFYSKHSNVSNLNYERLNKIILESSKQCGRSKTMELAKEISFTQASKESLKNGGKTILFYEQERKRKVKDCIFPTDDRLNIFIGCEGGFSEEEIFFIRESNIPVLTLGKSILRVETALVCALSLCKNAIGEI